MTGDAATPIQPPEQRPRPSGGALRLLEMFMFAAVFIAGGLLSWLAAFGESEAQTFRASEPAIPVPVTTGSPPDLGIPESEPEMPGAAPEVGGQVLLSSARTEVAPPTGGCDTHIDYIWEIDRGMSPRISGRALIEVNGPGVSGDYQRPVQGNEIRLSLDVTIPGNSVFEADVVSVGGVPAFPTPLQATFTDAYC